MNQTHVEALLPLWVEGDLPGEEARGVADHLQHCAPCRAAAEALAASQTWLKDAAEAPFSEGERARFHREVLERAHEPASRLRPILAAAALLLALLGVTLVSGRRRAAPLPPPPAVARTAPDLPRPPVPPASHPRIRPAPPGRPALARLELQTSDPHIRIIWLAQATPQPH
jgi:anti-sigma factor RsiW